MRQRKNFDKWLNSLDEKQAKDILSSLVQYAIDSEIIILDEHNIPCWESSGEYITN